ncbi:amino acid ABC transporter substrate-binding protein, partial [Dissulfurirhabdus thermomarina]|nr:amino acid ABC transporter substrate-binding protein [Dissulfurirhabdus thermomarina]
RRLSCQACHSTWVPQCYGCHVRADRSQAMLDKVAARETPGRWSEFRSFMRHESPPLGRKGDEVVILVPG